MTRDYDFQEIETRLAKRWVDENPWAAPEKPVGRKRYTVTMFPYPSGDMHMGHVEIFSIADAIARYSRMQGFDVLHPLGFDAFGLPAENAAIKRGINPTDLDVPEHRPAALVGRSAWDAPSIGVVSSGPATPSTTAGTSGSSCKFFERGLAYRAAAAVNWCPNDKTVLANEQVIAGRCERCDTPVVKRRLTQWFFKITDYADRLLDDMELNTGWSERLRMLQRNWIGRSEGAEVEFQIDGLDRAVTVFTTRPDTLWGATFFVVAPEHELLDELVAGSDKGAELAEFREEVSRLSEIDRTSTEREKKGMFTGRYAINPVNQERIPIWAADYVLMDYGTGAIMAVPAHDQRDFEFARQYELPIRVVIQPPGETIDPDSMAEAFPHDGVMVNSESFDGTPADEAVDKVTEWLESKNLGRRAKNFRLRDWLISRQRYWGTPIPIIHCPSCGEVPVPDDELPVELPDVVDFNPTGEASPLATADEWVNVECPKCGGAARRETDTMDTFVDSSWYFHRYTDPHNEDAPFDRDKDDAWFPIDQYSGGIEHAVLHLIYARFFQKVFMDMGMARDPEPFPSLLNQGTITMQGKRMSKSRGNLVSPGGGVRALRGRFTSSVHAVLRAPPNRTSIGPRKASRRSGRVTFPWLQRVWRLSEDVAELGPDGGTGAGDAEQALLKFMHRTIKVVTADYESLSFNTATARLMELVNETYRYRAAGGADPATLAQRGRERAVDALSDDSLHDRGTMGTTRSRHADPRREVADVRRSPRTCGRGHDGRAGERQGARHDPGISGYHRGRDEREGSRVREDQDESERRRATEDHHETAEADLPSGAEDLAP